MPMRMGGARAFRPTRLLGWGLVSGIGIQALLAWIVAHMRSDTFASVLLWNVWLLGLLAGPGPVIGHDSSGRPLHEGTPIHVLMAFIGLAFGVAVYSVISHFVPRPHIEVIEGAPLISARSFLLACCRISAVWRGSFYMVSVACLGQVFLSASYWRESA